MRRLMDNRVRILIADDHTLLREAIRHILTAEDDLRVTGEAADGEAAVEQAMLLKPDVVLLDVEMPGGKPSETVRRIRFASPRSRIVVLSMHDDPQVVREMLDSGACGYLHKSVSRHALAAAIRAVHQVEPAQRSVVVSVPQQQVPTSGPALRGALSGRETEVLVLVASALSNRQVAKQLAITEATVKRHMRNIFEKLDAVSRIDAVNKATTAGLIHSECRRYQPSGQLWPGAEAEPA